MASLGNGGEWPKESDGIGFPKPIFTSTPGTAPLMGAKEGTGFKNDLLHMPSETEDKRAYVDMTDMRVQHLTELLENERRAVKLLSHFSNVDLGSAKSIHMEVDTGRSQPGSSDEMPVLETMYRVGTVSREAGRPDKNAERTHKTYITKIGVLRGY